MWNDYYKQAFTHHSLEEILLEDDLMLMFDLIEMFCFVLLRVCVCARAQVEGQLQKTTLSSKIFLHRCFFNHSFVILLILRAWSSLCVPGLCSLRDGPVTDSEGVIRNPARPGDRYDNNQ